MKGSKCQKEGSEGTTPYTLPPKYITPYAPYAYRAGRMGSAAQEDQCPDSPDSPDWIARLHALHALLGSLYLSLSAVAFNPCQIHGTFALQDSPPAPCNWIPEKLNTHTAPHFHAHETVAMVQLSGEVIANVVITVQLLCNAFHFLTPTHTRMMQHGSRRGAPGFGVRRCFYMDGA